MDAVTNISVPAASWTQMDAGIQCESNPPEIFWHLFQNGWEFLVQILQAYYMFLLDYNFFYSISCNFDEVMPY